MEADESMGCKISVACLCVPSCLSLSACLCACLPFCLFLGVGSDACVHMGVKRTNVYEFGDKMADLLGVNL